MRTQAIILALVIVLTCPMASAQWEQRGLPNRGIGEIAVGSSRIFAVTSDSGCVFRSTDGGANWLQVVPFGGTHIAVAPNGTTFMAVGDTLYRSTDGGVSWTNLRMHEQINVGTNNLNIYCVAVGPYGGVFSGVYARHVGDGNAFGPVLAVSTDNGTTWNCNGFWGGESYSFRGHCVITSGFWTAVTTGWVGSAFSFDDAITWNPSRFVPRPPFIWCSSGTILFREFVGGGPPPWGGGSGGLFVSADTGISSTQVSEISPSAFLALPQNGVLVGADTTGVYLFTDNGDSIKTLNEGLTDLHVHVVALDSSGYAYVGTNNGIWRRPMSQIVSVEEPVTSIPVLFSLYQNYPNPFNPSTTIRYELPKSSMVRLSVYDILGREVNVLVNERTNAGVHEVKFDASAFSTGVYFYRLQAGDFVQTKKLMILK